MTVRHDEADGLREHLRSHNIETAPPQPAVGPYVTIELIGDWQQSGVAEILAEWEGT